MIASFELEGIVSSRKVTLSSDTMSGLAVGVDKSVGKVVGGDSLAWRLVGRSVKYKGQHPIDSNREIQFLGDQWSTFP